MDIDEEPPMDIDMEQPLNSNDTTTSASTVKLKQVIMNTASTRSHSL